MWALAEGNSKNVRTDPLVPVNAEMVKRVASVLGNVTVDSMNEADLQDVVALHFRLLNWSSTSRLGCSFLSDLYSAIFASPDFFGYVLRAKGEIIGFSTGTRDFGDNRVRMSRVFRNKKGYVLEQLLRNPRAISNLAESAFLIPMIYKKLETRAEWLTFVVDTKRVFLGSFFAIALIDATRQHFLSEGLHTYVAQGVRDNPEATRLYRKLGWKPFAKLPVHDLYQFTTL